MVDYRDEVEEVERNFEGRVMKEIIDHGKETAAARIGSWMIMGNVCDSEQSDDDESSSDEEDSEGSDVSSVFSDMAVEEDVSSSSSSSSFSNGPLYELSELLAQLPPTSQRSGLSKHYQGKSQSFTSLASVKSVDDLAKRAKPYRKNMKRQCKYYTTPKAMISKKQQQKKKISSSSSRVSFLSPVTNARGSFFLNSVCKSSISLQKQKNFG